MITDRHMIRLDRKPQLFSFRVAALIFQNGHFLLHNSLNRDRFKVKIMQQI